MRNPEMNGSARFELKEGRKKLPDLRQSGS